jgi:hypothetical protein
MEALRMKYFIALLMATLALTACSKLTAENYAKIQTGMSFAEVSTILGGPESCDDTLGFKSCTWGKDSSKVTVQFVADKVVLHAAEHIR